MTLDRLIDLLRANLRRDVETLGTFPDTPTGRRTLRRLLDVAEHAPVFFGMLVEPLMRDDREVDDVQIITDCARVHLYARVLDDALDENLPLDRRNLLRIQPLFWRAVYSLAARYPTLGDATRALLQCTVDSVEADDERIRPDLWAGKNLHLLLAPLLLSGDGAIYRAARPGLVALIAMAQANEELEQGRIRSSALRDELAVCVSTWLDDSTISTLRQLGWHHAAARLVADGGAVLAGLHRIPTTP